MELLRARLPFARLIREQLRKQSGSAFSIRTGERLRVAAKTVLLRASLDGPERFYVFRFQKESHALNSFRALPRSLPFSRDARYEARGGVELAGCSPCGF